MSWLRRIQSRAAPPIRTYARELGWTSQPSREGGTIHQGYYRALGLRWDGYVHQTFKGLDFFILNPPIQLIRDTNFGGCFHARNDGWWLVAFKPDAKPSDLDSGVAAIQHVLLNAFEVRAAKRRQQ